MKRFLALFMAFVFCFAVCGCGSSDSDYSSSYDSYDDYDSFTNDYGSKTTVCAQSGCSNYIASSGDTAYCVTHSNNCLECYCYIDGDAMYCMDCLYSAIDGDDDDSGYFSNDYGSKTTICAQSGCSNYIASSGDTAYCVTHSNNCLECYCYIDGDAMYCMDCLYSAIDGGDDYSSSYSSGHECYICGESAYSQYGSYYYCSSCLELVKAFS